MTRHGLNPGFQDSVAQFVFDTSSGHLAVRCASVRVKVLPGAASNANRAQASEVSADLGRPEKPAFEVARELGVAVTTHAGVWGATGDDGIRLMHDHGFMTPETVYVHAASLSADSYHRIAATGRKADARWGRAGARYRIAPLSEAEVRLAPHPALRGSRFGEWRVMPEPHASG